MLDVLDPGSTLPAASIAAPLDLGAPARELLRADAARNLRHSLDALLATGAATDAAKLLAAALPKRYAVGWVCDCIRHDLAPAPPDAVSAEAALVATAERWLRENSEDARRAAQVAAEATAFDTPAAWVAAAAGWSGGSLLPEGFATVPPAERLTRDACATALVLLAAREPERFEARVAGCVARALAVFGAPGEAGR